MIDSEVSQSQNEQVIHGLAHCTGGGQLKVIHMTSKSFMDLLNLAALRVRYLGLEVVGEATRCAIEREMGLQEHHLVRYVLSDIKCLLFVVINQLQKSFLSSGLALNQVLHHRGGLALASYRGIVLFRGQAALRLGLACCLNYNSASVHILIVFCHLQPQLAHTPCLYLTQRRLRET